MKTERFDIHKHITDRIIVAIERGAGEFRLPWHRSAGNIMRPVNIASKKAESAAAIIPPHSCRIVSSLLVAANRWNRSRLC